MRRYLIFVLVTFSVAIILVENGYTGNWTKKLIGNEGDVPSIALDKNGNAHIFWVRLGGNSDNDLIHSWFDGRLWHSERFDSFNTGTYSCATADQDGNIHLVYGYDLWTSERQVKYAVFDGDSWKSLTIESGGFNPSIAIAPDGFPRIIHIISGVGTLRYLAFDGVSWTGEDMTLASARGNMGTSMGFLPDGRPVVAWTDGGSPYRVHVAQREGNTWTSLAVYEGLAARMAVDKNGVIHLVYNRESEGQFIYARYDGMQWEEETLTTSSNYFEKNLSPGFEAVPDTQVAPDIVIDDEGRAHVILVIRIHNQRTWGKFHLIYGFLDETGWHSDDLAQAGDTTPFSYRIVLNPQGIPRVATSRYTMSLPVEYYQHTGKKLSVSVKGNGTVTSIPGGIACGTDCGESFFPGNSVTVTAVPSPGMNFLGWSGACQGTDPACTLIMDKPKKVTAKFGP